MVAAWCIGLPTCNSDRLVYWVTLLAIVAAWWVTLPAIVAAWCVGLPYLQQWPPGVLRTLPVTVATRCVGFSYLQ